MCRTFDGADSSGDYTFKGTEPDIQTCQKHCDDDTGCWYYDYNYPESDHRCYTFSRDPDQQLTGNNVSVDTVSCFVKNYNYGINYVDNEKMEQPGFTDLHSAITAFNKVEGNKPKVLFNSNAFFSGAVWIGI